MRTIAPLSAAFIALASGAALAAPASGPIASAHPEDNGRDTRALNMLEANGYAAFSNFRQQGNDFAADVKQNGRQFTVLVDPDSGKITPQR
jgi:hypothetical protein